MTDRRDDPEGLEVFFDAARRDRPRLSDDALARMTAQALDMQPGRAAAPAPVPRRRLWSQLIATIGGWPALAGLATAGVAGLWIGAVPPAMLQTLASDLTGAAETTEDDIYLVDPIPGYMLSLNLAEGS